MARRGSGQNGRRPRVWNRRWVKLAAAALLIAGVAAAGAGTGLVLGAIRTLPALTRETPLILPSEIYDADGKLLTKIFDTENREPIPIDQVPEHVQNAFVAVEDERFWTHRGVDLIAIGRALLHDVLGRDLQGASTITQQLARNAFPIGRERSLRRKLQEAVLAIELERRYTKQEILEMYLNRIYFGRNAYGIQVAAQTYFGKPAKDLTLAEGALLAGLPQAPNAYEPIGNPENARQRRNVVLNLMADKGLITREAAEAAKKEPVRTAQAPRTRTPYPAAHYVDYVLSQLLKRYPAEQVYRGGLKIYTALRPEIQKAAEDAIARYLDKDFPLGQGREVPQAAVVVLDQETGAIVAMVGGRSHERMLELNRAWFDPEANCCVRQPGSAFKPLAVYLPAFTRGMTPATVMEDALKSYPAPRGEWTPANFDRTYRGPTTLREAVRRSVNTVAVRTLEAIGVDSGYEMAERLGITTLVPSGPTNDRNLALALGALTRGASVLDMARAYAAIANGGQRIDNPVAVLRVEDAQGNVLQQGRARKTRVVDERHAYLMLDVLRSVVEPQPPEGWLQNVGIGANALVPALDAAGRPTGHWPTAGKTGTTEENKDVWFVGFTPRYTAAVWIGFDNRERTGSLPRSVMSGLQPSFIFRDTMAAAHRGLAPVAFRRPSGLVEKEVAINSGKLPGPDTPPAFVRRELFVSGTEPTAVDDGWVRAAVCREQPDRLYRPSCACTPEERFFPRDPKPGEDLIPFPPDVPRAPVLACDGSALPAAPPSEAVDLGGGEGQQASLRLIVRRGALEPSFVRVRPGTQIRITAFAPDSPHRLVLPELGLALAVPGGGFAEGTVTASRPGSFSLRCADHPGEVLRLSVAP